MSDRSPRRAAARQPFLTILGGLCALLGVALMGLGGLARWLAPARATTPTTLPATLPAVLPATATPEPLVPTRTAPAPSPTPTEIPPTALPPTLPLTETELPGTPLPTGTPATSGPAPSETPTPEAEAPGEGRAFVPRHERHRLCISIPYGASTAYDLDALGVGAVMDWSTRASPDLPPGVDYLQMVRMKGGVLTPDAATLTAVAAARPGSTWLISNEADVRWQDNVEPATYARLYHEAYGAIKAGDPGAVVAAGGIAQPTPLRFRYLDAVLAAYREVYGAPLPADAWQIHNYLLREERDSWGVDIPPGIPEDRGVLYAIDDSGNLPAFREQIYAFRRWMRDRGYGGQPLIVSEFGIPMPPDYGFPPERVAGFLEESWRFFLTAADPALGDPSDGGRLVQRWCWFSMFYPEYPTGNLIEVGDAWTPLGERWIEYVGGAP